LRDFCAQIRRSSRLFLADKNTAKTSFPVIGKFLFQYYRDGESLWLHRIIFRVRAILSLVPLSASMESEFYSKPQNLK
jgi:hypothetical protein